MSIPAPRNILCSFHYFRDYNLDQYANLHIVGDSGAFSAESQGAKISTADLAGWAKQWRHRLSWVAALDVIGDPVATRRNWLDMVENHGVPGVPTIHFGEDPSTLDFYAERGVDFVGLGGMVGKHTAKQMRWLITVFRYARDHHPDMRFHGWGVTADSVLQLPFYSVDSSGWTSGLRYGRATIRDPKSSTDHQIQLNGRDVFRPAVGRLLIDEYGVNPADVARSSGENRRLVVKVVSLSASVQEQRFRRLHGKIERPAWGRIASMGGVGPGLHLADTAAVNLGWVAEEAAPRLHLANINPQLFLDVADEASGPHLHLAVKEQGDILNAQQEAT